MPIKYLSTLILAITLLTSIGLCETTATPVEESRVGIHLALAPASLKDKAVVQTSTQHLAGRVSKTVATVLIDNQTTPLTEGWFNTDVTLKPGKNAIKIVCLNTEGHVVDATWVRVLLKHQYLDVKPDDWTSAAVEDLATLGVFKDSSVALWDAKAPVSLAAISASLFNEYGYDFDPKLSQLPQDKRIVESAKKAGLMQGFDQPKRLNPQWAVSWRRALTMVMNAEGLTNAFPRQKTQALQDHRLLRLMVEKGYVPADVMQTVNMDKRISKSELAYVLSKTIPYERAITNLYDWDSYLSDADRVFYKTIERAKTQPEG